jgi:hypothetical protein
MPARRPPRQRLFCTCKACGATFGILTTDPERQPEDYCLGGCERTCKVCRQPYRRHHTKKSLCCSPECALRLSRVPG